MRRNNRDKDCKDVNSLFNPRFRCHRVIGLLSPYHPFSLLWEDAWLLLVYKRSRADSNRCTCRDSPVNLWDTALFTLSVPTSWNRNSRSICAILFRPASGEWSFSRHFQCLLVNDVHGQSQFFLFIQNGICICCMSDARTLGGFSCETSCLLVVKTKERIS